MREKASWRNLAKIQPYIYLTFCSQTGKPHL